MMKKVFSAALLAVFCATTQAATVTVDIVGLVNYSTAGEAAGQEIRLRLSYDTSADAGTPGFNYAVYEFGSPHVVRGEFGSQSFTTNSLRIVVSNDQGSSIQDSLDFIGDLDATQSFACDACYFAMSLASPWWNADALSDLSLPTSIDLSQFNAPGYTYGGIYSASASQGEQTQLAFDIVSLTTHTVNEPAGLALLSATLLALLGVRGRHRAYSRGAGNGFV